MQAEQEAFLEELYRNYLTKLTIYASSALGDRSRAQDLAQDVFHEAIIHIDTLMAHENPGAWLMQTAKNKIHEYHRAYTRYIQTFISLDYFTCAGIGSAEDSIMKIDESINTSPIKRIEQILSSEEFSLLKRLIFEKASHLEVAKELGITVWTSQKRLERIRKKLLEIFPEHKNKNNFKK